MQRKKIHAKGVILRKPTGIFPLIAKFSKGSLTVGMLPIPVDLVDEQTLKIEPAHLVECVPFSLGVVPSGYSYLAEGYPPTDMLVAKLLERANVKEVNQLAIYIYKYDGNNMHNSDQKLFEEIHSEK